MPTMKPVSSIFQISFFPITYSSMHSLNFSNHSAITVDVTFRSKMDEEGLFEL